MAFSLCALVGPSFFTWILRWLARTSHFFQLLSQRHSKLLFFISDLMDYFLAGVDQQQTYQPNGLADGQPQTSLFHFRPNGLFFGWRRSATNLSS